MSEEITVTNTVPIAMKVIQGKIPNFYLDDIKNSSNMMQTPVN